MQTTSASIYPPELKENKPSWLWKQWNNSKWIWEISIATVCIGSIIVLAALIIVKPDEKTEFPLSMYKISGIICNSSNSGSRITKFENAQSTNDYVCLKNTATWMWVRQPME